MKQFNILGNWYCETDIHSVWKKGATIFLPLTLQNTDQFSSKATINIRPHIKRVATLFCEMFVLKNRHAPEVRGANCHAVI